MQLKIFTSASVALGSQSAFVSTKIASSDVVGVGKGYRAVVIENPKRRCYHLALVGCGAIVATERTRDEAVAKVKSDIRACDRAMLSAQESQGRRWLATATEMENGEFFDLFKGYRARK